MTHMSLKSSMYENFTAPLTKIIYFLDFILIHFHFYFTFFKQYNVMIY